MEIGFSIDEQQGLSESDEIRCVRMAAELGYTSAWTPAHADATAFDRCLAWHQVTGLPTGISVVPASAGTYSATSPLQQYGYTPLTVGKAATATT